MKITKIQVHNYRLLKDFSIDLENDLSLVIGKNNCGKTSLLSVLDKFLNGGAHSFSFDDFNLDYKKELMDNIEGTSTSISSYTGITLTLFVKYFPVDNLSNISRLMMDLDPSNDQIILSFEYILANDDILKLKTDFSLFKTDQSEKREPKDLDYFLKENFSKYFNLYIKTVDACDSTKFIDLEKAKISLKDVISFNFISANRNVSDKESGKSLSNLSSKIYEKLEADKSNQARITEFKDALCAADVDLGDIYEKIFKDTIAKVKKFGGIKPGNTEIKVTSSLQHKELLKDNTTIMYRHETNLLPESYNGLGYMNLISMIFEIEILISKFKRSESEKPADINLLFLEEPEAHTHPQMQYVFIKNIKNLLKNCIVRADGENRELQYIITTHSSHIVAESEFDDIKYLKSDGKSVIAKNMRDLEKEYTELVIVEKREVGKKNYKFLKQYLTLHRAELFFADKAIFIEGDTERILLPAMMKKIDQESTDNPLLSQNISIIEVGNYSHIFEKFINFLGIKSLIVTDIDSGMSKTKLAELKKTDPDIKQKVRVSDPNASVTTNSSLQFFYRNEELFYFMSKPIDQLKLSNEAATGLWKVDLGGPLLCVYQTSEINSNGVTYHARSFEDSFFHLNRQFIIDNKETFNSLRNISSFENSGMDAYELSEICIDKKPPFAIEILLNSKKDISNWQTPDYIKQGLLWLKD